MTARPPLSTPRACLERLETLMRVLAYDEYVAFVEHHAQPSSQVAAQANQAIARARR